MKYIDGYVQINNLYLKEIPEILNGVHIKGDFDVSFNILKSLNNSPVKVDGAFKCRYNKNLKSLVGGPKEVKSLIANNCSLRDLNGIPNFSAPIYKYINTGNIDLSSNQLTSLVGLPTKVFGKLSIYNNPGLKTLNGCSEHIKGDFEALWLPITNCIGGPKYVGGDLYLYDTDINSLEGFPEEVSGNVFLGNTPLGSILFPTNGGQTSKAHALYDEIRKICKIHGDIYKTIEDVEENPEIEMDEPEYEPDDQGGYRRV
jgi:hypothetical protein